MKILFDIGGTKTRLAFSEDGKSFGEPKIFETPKSYEKILEIFKKELENKKVEGVVVGVSRNVISDYNKLKTDLQKIFNTEVVVENDAALAGLGEANFGAGRGFEIVAYITVSTGVGGTRIVNGKLDEKNIGFEPGKQIMNVETGETLETLISGRALSQKFGKHPKEISDPEVWQYLAKKLALGLNNIIVEWSPSVVVLGGSMITGDPSIPLEKTQEYLKEILKIVPLVPIKKAELGDFGGLWGGLKL